MLKWSTIKSLQPPILVVSWVFSHRHEFLKCLQKKKNQTIKPSLNVIGKGLFFRISERVTVRGSLTTDSVLSILFSSGTAQATHTSAPPFRLVVEAGWRGGQRPFSLIMENQLEMVMYNPGLGEMRVKTRVLSRLLENQTCSFLLEILAEKVISKSKLPRTTVDMKLLQIQSHSKDRLTPIQTHLRLAVLCSLQFLPQHFPTCV